MTIDKTIYIPIEQDKIEGLIDLLQECDRIAEANLNRAHLLPSSNKIKRQEKYQFIAELKERKEYIQYYLKQTMDAYDESRPYYKGGRHNVGGT